MVVEVQDLRRSYGTFHALKGVSLRVERGQVVGLLGPNGAGKTTMMRILAGLLAPTGGRAQVLGLDVLLHPQEVQRQLGYLPETAPVHADLTVSAYLRFIARARGLGRSEATQAITRVAEATGLTARLPQRVATLSRGYRQRVGLAQALVHQPPLLILDEPTAGLDPNQVAEIRGLIRGLGRRHTVLLSTHILSEVEALCDRVIILHQGQVVADDTTEAVLAYSRGRTLRVGLAEGPVRLRAERALTELAALPGVSAVRPLAPGQEAHRFELTVDLDVRAAVYHWAVREGHVLVELAEQTTHLEDVFRSLTSEKAA